MLCADQVCCHAVDHMYVAKLSMVSYKLVATVCVGVISQVRAKLVGSGAPTYSEYTCYTGIADFTPPDIDTVGYRVFLGNGQYFVSSDVGGGKMQWYGFHKEPAGMHLLLLPFCFHVPSSCHLLVHIALLPFVLSGGFARWLQAKVSYHATWPNFASAHSECSAC